MKIKFTHLHRQQQGILDFNSKYMSYWHFGFTHIVCLYLRIRKLPFCQNFKWVHFRKITMKQAFGNYLMGIYGTKELDPISGVIIL